MSQLRFKHVFLILMALSALSAFLISRSLSDRARDSVQNLFGIVAVPTRKVAGWVHDRLNYDAKADSQNPAGADHPPRTLPELKTENAQLQLLVSNLVGELEALKQVNADRQRLGSVRARCLPMAVLGSDSGLRQSLSLRASSFDGLAKDMPVLYSGSKVGGIAGRIDRAGAGGAQVQLITDKAFRVAVGFGRWRKLANGQLEFTYLRMAPQLLSGQGDGTMSIANLSWKDAQEAGLAKGDLVVLEDPDWPMSLRGYYLGRISQDVAPRKDHLLFADIQVAPPENLSLLREVMVLVKDWRD